MQEVVFCSLARTRSSQLALLEQLCGFICSSADSCYSLVTFTLCMEAMIMGCDDMKCHTCKF